MATEKLKDINHEVFDHIPAEVIQAGGITVHSEIHKLLILRGIRKNCLNIRSQSLHLVICRVIKTDCSNRNGLLLLSPNAKFYSTFFCQC
jgi:hypothetical protein